MTDINLGQTAASTLRNRDGEVANSVLDNVSVMAWLKKKGKVKTKSGGRTFVFPIYAAENGSAKFYDGGMESFDIAPEQILDASEYDRKFQAGFISFDESERQSNKGEAEVIDLMEAKIENLKDTLTNQFSTSFFGDGTTAKEVQGLQALVADDPTTGTVGGINAANYAFWRNQYKTDTTASASNIESLMDGMQLDTVRGTDRPDLIVAGNNMFTYYKNALRADQRLIGWDEADTLNFEGLKYQGATVLYDPGCSTKRMYGLNSKDLFLICDSGRKWSVGSHRDVTNALYEVVPVLWSGCVATRRRESHWVIEGT